MFKLDPPAIPQPLANLGSLLNCVSALKEGLEVVLGVRGGTGVAGGINAVESSIDKEAAARLAAEAKLQGHITDEVNARLSADTDLQDQVTGEVTDRQVADASLQSQIDARASSATVSALQTQVDGIQDELDALGAVVSSSVLLASAVPLTTGTTANVTSISLPAGVWEIYANVAYDLQGATIQEIKGAISTTNAVMPTSGTQSGVFRHTLALTGVSDGTAFDTPCGSRRLSLPSTTTVYLVAQAVFSAGTAKAFGYIEARTII